MRMDGRDHEMLSGGRGAAPALAMSLLSRVGRVGGASRFIDVTCAHIDGCLYHGEAGLDFAERLVRAGARVAVPTTLNVSSLDLLHPELYRGDAATAARARRLMEAYVSMGCEATWTCAPYQQPRRPGLGEHVAWAESNAIVFANSVLGARTDRYGDFIDICAAITGRVPYAGLHCIENRHGEVVFDVGGLRPDLLGSDAFHPVLGHFVGREAGTRVPVIVGLPPQTGEDALKALGAAAASSGAVAMFHAVGITPEAPTLAAALGGRPPRREVHVDMPTIRRAAHQLTTSVDGPLIAVSLGTPHFSLTEFQQVLPLLEGARFAAGIDVYISTSRHVLGQVPAPTLAILEAAGVQLVTDTCTYITPILRRTDGVVMTNSAKWAYYAPGNLGVHVAFGSAEECIRSAVAGRILRDDALWRD